VAIPSRPDQPADPPPASKDEAPGQRAATDASLNTERHTADGREQAGALQEDADRVVDVARARADAILSQAREKADNDLQETGSADDVAQERADADEILQDERDVADEILRREREDSARVLSALLPLARKSTDRRLLTERASSDAALAYRDDFLGMVSHDLNNLLTGIVLSSSFLASGASETPEGKRVVRGAGRIQLYAARMKRLISDLTDVTSLAAGKLAITTAEHDASALVAEAVEAFRGLASEKRILLEAERADSVLVICDRGRILQVLSNLLGNAVKFTPDGGGVSAHTLRIGDYVRFSVEDTGPGIPENLLEAVFERFWQAGKDDRRGLGLGLYIAQSIVEAHAGRIWAESRLGEGSRFHFTLPIGAPSNQDAAQANQVR
jgi:signal transduction histidine kinase